MPASYNLALVALSILVAMVVAYTALRLVARVSATEGRSASFWLGGGALVMGAGVWSMHFIGMLAFDLPIQVRYSVPLTLGSLVIAIATSGIALAFASRPRLPLKRLAAGALVMGAGICGMHYTGMAAITVEPGISYDWGLVAASALIAVSASFAALWLAFNLRGGRSWLAVLGRVGAAAIMGAAISGMHYTAMGAAQFVPGAICRGGASLNGAWFASGLGLIALSILAITLITSVYDAHLQSSALAHATRLERVNEELRHRKELLALAAQAAGISSWEFDLLRHHTLWRENEIESLRGGVSDERGVAQTHVMIHPDDREMIQAAVRDAYAAGRDRCAYRVRYVARDGATVHVQSHALIICDETGVPVRLLGVSWDVTESVTHAQQRGLLETQLRQASREAGMAEVATGVLHNVGNVLTSLGVSASLLQSRLRELKVDAVARTAALLGEQGAQAGSFIDLDPRGQRIPGYLVQLGEHLLAERDALLHEADALAGHVEHVRAIVAAQQSYARHGGSPEAVNVAALLDHAIALHFTGCSEIELVRDYQPLPLVNVDRHKLLQVLSNLCSNSRQAVEAGPSGLKRVALHIAREDDGILIEVRDSGIGMSEETRARLFEFGFTTKRDGHGFGLHTSAILAKELGGTLGGTSDGIGKGACFTLHVPLSAAQKVARVA